MMFAHGKAISTTTYYSKVKSTGLVAHLINSIVVGLLLIFRALLVCR